MNCSEHGLQKIEKRVKVFTRCVFNTETDRASEKKNMRQISTEKRLSVSTLESKEKSGHDTDFYPSRSDIGAYGHFLERKG